MHHQGSRLLPPLELPLINPPQQRLQLDIVSKQELFLPSAVLKGLRIPTIQSHPSIDETCSGESLQLRPQVSLRWVLNFHFARRTVPPKIGSPKPPSTFMVCLYHHLPRKECVRNAVNLTQMMTQPRFCSAMGFAGANIISSVAFRRSKPSPRAISFALIVPPRGPHRF